MKILKTSHAMRWSFTPKNREIMIIIIHFYIITSLINHIHEFVTHDMLMHSIPFFKYRGTHGFRKNDILKTSTYYINTFVRFKYVHEHCVKNIFSQPTENTRPIIFYPYKLHIKMYNVSYYVLRKTD